MALALALRGRGMTRCLAAEQMLEMEDAYLFHLSESMLELPVPDVLEKICKDGLKPGTWTTYAAR